MFLQAFLHSTGHGQGQVVMSQSDTSKGVLCSFGARLQALEGRGGTAGQADIRFPQGRGGKLLSY